QTIIGGNVDVGITDNDVRIAHVRRFHGKADDPPNSGCNPAFLNAAGGRIQFLIADYPLMAKKIAVHIQVWHSCGIWLTVRALQLSMAQDAAHEYYGSYNEILKSHGYSTVPLTP